MDRLHTLLTATLLLAFSTSTQGSPFGPKAGDLLQACEKAEPLYEGYCIGYLKAFRDWYFAVKDDFLAANMHHCEPSGISYRQIKSAVVTYLKGHPKIQEEPRLLAVTQALANTWPCPNGELRLAQALLKALGYSVPIDGLDGSATRAAVEAFVKQSKMPPPKTPHELVEHLIQYLSRAEPNAQAPGRQPDLARP